MLRLIGIAALLGSAMPLLDQSQGRIKRVELQWGLDSTGLMGKVVGNDDITYLFPATAGKFLHIKFETGNLANGRFSVTAPGATAAMFTGSDRDALFKTKVPAAGEYRIRVYLTPEAARGGEQVDYRLVISQHTTG